MSWNTLRLNWRPTGRRFAAGNCSRSEIMRRVRNLQGPKGITDLALVSLNHGALFGAAILRERFKRVVGSKYFSPCLTVLIERYARLNGLSLADAAHSIGRKLMEGLSERRRFIELTTGPETVTLFALDDGDARRWFDQASAAPSSDVVAVTVPAARIIAAKVVYDDRFEVVLAPEKITAANREGSSL